MDQKLEDLLNLALGALPEERAKSMELDVGFSPAEELWELIIKYSGSLDEIKKRTSSVTELTNEYAVITIKESDIPILSLMPQIEYIEKPKSLYFQTDNGKRASCIASIQKAPFSLFGQGVLTAVIDSGIDYANPAFRNPDGTTRIKLLWDQSVQGKPPKGYSLGTEYTGEEINEALSAADENERYKLVPSADVSGHGTAVAGIAAGNGAGSAGNRYAGAAPLSELLIVKMARAKENSFPRTTELMQGVDYAVRKAVEFQMPVAVNLSFGNTYGPHDGTSLLERFLDDISNYGKSVICVGSGNEGNGAGHTSGFLSEGEEEVIEFGIQIREPTVNIQIWKEYVDNIEISVIGPSGEQTGKIRSVPGAQRFVLGNTELLIYYGEPSPYSTKQEIYIDFLPRESYVDAGLWRIVLTPVRIVTGVYNMWLPAQNILNKGTAFLFPKSEMTQTIPSTASRVVTVGAYDALTFTYADFSGRGEKNKNSWNSVQKPDIAAPGVDVVSTAAGGGYVRVTGTSFAVPFVTGAAALLMEWGIVRGNDPYLYGEKVKAYLRKGAQKLPDKEGLPNNKIGWGSLCVRESLPRPF